MIRILIGIFIVLHGLVHLLYLGQSSRVFELRPGLEWPDGAWAFANFLGTETTRMLANIFLVIAALLFVGGGTGVLFNQEWWQLVVIVAAVFSTIVYILLWNGKFERMADNGWVGILINLVILAVLILFKWPDF